jgi:uncharacterized protein
MSSGNSVRIVSLHVYPIKGCRAVDLASSRVLATGLQFDRRWMFVDDDGRFLSQRECAGLALVDVEVAPDELTLRAAGHAPLRCPTGERGLTRRVTIWKDQCLARVNEVDTRDWLERVTGVRGQLVGGIEGEARVCDPAFTGPDPGRAFFPDAYSLLLTNPASLAALNQRLDEPLPMNRFRPNIVIEGLEPFAEDRVTWLHGGDLALKCVKPCTRCIVTTTDQRTGERRGEEPLRELRRFRFVPALKGVAFGMNAIVSAGMDTRIAVGDRLSVTWQSQERWTVRAAGGKE